MANKKGDRGRKGYRGKRRVVHLLGSRIVDPEQYTPNPGMYSVHSESAVFEFPVKPLLTEGDACVPNVVLTDPALLIEARMAYALLTAYAYPVDDETVCDMHIWKLAQLLDRSERYAHDMLTMLKEHGYIAAKRMGYDKPNRYTLLAHKTPARTVATVTLRG